MAAGATYEPIATITSTGQATVTFNSITGSYTDLRLVVNGYYSGTTYGTISINGSSSSLSWTRLLGYSGGPLGDRATGAGGADMLSLNNTNAGNCEFDFLNYSNSTTYKTFLLNENAGTGSVGRYVCLWSNTSPITSISFTAKSSGTFVSGTTFTLYGISAA